MLTHPALPLGVVLDVGVPGRDSVPVRVSPCCAVAFDENLVMMSRSWKLRTTAL